jgi:uroporphyrinogen-III synthase
VKVLLTRPEGRNEELARLLRAAGHEVECAPLIALEPLGDEPIDLDGYDWVLVTSAAGARELRRRGSGRPGGFAAIGRATAEALGGADLVARVSTQEGLLAELPRPAGRVLFAGAESARRLLVDELNADFVPLYRTRGLAPELPPADLVVLASPSAARVYAAIGGRGPAVSIGPETTSAAKSLGLDVVGEASTQDADGLLAAVEATTR